MGATHSHVCRAHSLYSHEERTSHKKAHKAQNDLLDLIALFGPHYGKAARSFLLESSLYAPAGNLTTTNGSTQ
jgi:hypothetical protein